jgi:DNA-binding response OmpR family regulator
MSHKPVILALDRNPRNLELLAGVLARAGYAALTAGSLEEIDQILTGAQQVALALLDVAGFDRNIWEHCALLRQKQVPFLVLSRRMSPLLEQESRACGARGVLVKPLAIQQLLTAVRELVARGEDV